MVGMEVRGVYGGGEWVLDACCDLYIFAGKCDGDAVTRMGRCFIPSPLLDFFRRLGCSSPLLFSISEGEGAERTVWAEWTLRLYTF